MKNEYRPEPPPEKYRRHPDGRLPRRILIVDDDSAIRDILRAFLGRFDFKVDLAENGQAALELFKQEPFDLVLTDLNMPVMGGLALMARIKALSRQTPVVVITGRLAEEVEQLDGIDASAAILYKPFNLNTLERTLGRILGSTPEPVL